MSVQTSIVIPALGDTALLEQNLPALFSALQAEEGVQEVVLVDDTGERVLASWAAETFPQECSGLLRVLS